MDFLKIRYKCKTSTTIDYNPVDGCPQKSLLDYLYIANCIYIFTINFINNTNTTNLKLSVFYFM